MKTAEEQITDAAAALSSALAGVAVAVATFGSMALLSFVLTQPPSRDRWSRFEATPPPSLHPQRTSRPVPRLPQYRRR